MLMEKLAQPTHLILPIMLFGLSFQPTAILMGILAGVIYGISYYVKEHLQKGEAFDSAKFSEAVTFGFVVGVIAGFAGITVTSAEQLFQQSAYYAVAVLVLHQFVIPIVTKLVEKVLAGLKPVTG